MNIGLFGGSFDPVHNGHISMIKGALKSGIVDIVIVIPAVRNSFKRGHILSPAPYRYYMTAEVLEDEFKKNVFISDIEFFMEGISYTANTVAALSGKDKIASFLKGKGFSESKAGESHSYYWICGTDILPSFDKWYKPDEIVKTAALLVARRPGDTTDITSEKKRLKAVLPDIKIKTFEIKGIEASSSDIRKRQDFDDVPKAALDFIREHDLYESRKVLDEVSEEAAESFMEYAIALYPYLREKRLLHTLNVGLLSAKLALIHGADADKALIAGELHDCAKEIDRDTQRRYAQEACGDLFEDEKLIHSPAGAVMAERFFGVDDKEILDAITYHTTGRGDMTLLDKIVYLADKIEPARTYTDLTPIREASVKDLNAALGMCVEAVTEKFKRQGRELHPYTSAFAESIKFRGSSR